MNELPSVKPFDKPENFDDLVVSELHMGSGSLTGLPTQSAPRIQMGWQEFNNSDPMVKIGENGRGAEVPYISTGHEMLRTLASFRIQLPLRGKRWIVQSKHVVGTNHFVVFKSDTGEIHIADYVNTINQGRRKAVSLFPPDGMPSFNKIKAGMNFKGGTVLLAPLSANDNWYTQGRNLNVLATSDRRVPDDGFVISETFANSTGAITTKVFDIAIHLNDVLVGNKHTGRYIPEVGDVIPPSGMIIAKRDLGSEVYNIASYIEYLRDPFKLRLTDNCKISQLPVEGVVTKVEIQGVIPKLNFIGNPGWASLTDILNKQLKEWKAFSEQPFLKEPKLTQDAALIANKAFIFGTGKFKLEDADDPIAPVTIRVEVQWKVPYHKGTKLATTIGGKGIVIKVLPDSQMPVDSSGVRADLLKGCNVAFKRNIPTDEILPLEGAIMRTGHIKMLKLLGLKMYASRESIKEALEKAPPNVITNLADMYLRLIRIFNVEQAELSAEPMMEDYVEWFTDILYDQLSVVRNLTQSMKLDIREIINNPATKEFAPQFEHIQIWSDRLNKYVPSPKKVFIGNQYMFGLYFDSYDPSATNSSRYYPDRTIAPKSPEELKDTTASRDSVLVVQGSDEITQVPQAAKLSTLAKFRYSTSNIDAFREQCSDYLINGVCEELDPEPDADLSTDGVIVLRHLLDIGGHRLTPECELGEKPQLVADWEIPINDIGNDMR